MEEPKSKSQKKREADTLQKIGVELIELSLEKLNHLPLSEVLRRAIVEAKDLKSHGAIRRQAQLIGKLMRSCDSDAILQAYMDLQSEESAQTADFHRAEFWRDRLIHEGKIALTEFIATYHPAETQSLRQLITKAERDLQTNQNTGASKKLFRFIRACIS